MLFKKKENNEIKNLKKTHTNKQVANYQNVINNFNQIVDVKNGYFITKNREVTFVYQLDNIDYNLLSNEQKNQTKFAYQNLITEFGSKQGFDKHTLLNQYVFKIPYKLEAYEETLANLIASEHEESKLRNLKQEQEQIQRINHHSVYHVLATFITITLPLKKLKQMYSVVNTEVLNKYYQSYKNEFEDIKIVDFKNEVDFIQLFLCNLYKNDMKLQSANFLNNEFDIENFINLKENKIQEEMWNNLSISKKLYAFLPNSLQFKMTHFITNENIYNGIINITKYPNYLDDCWGDSVYAICLENNNYIDNVSLKLTIDKSESNYYQEVIGKEFLDAENKLNSTADEKNFKFMQNFTKKTQTEKQREIIDTYNDYDDLNTYVKQGGLISDVYLSIRFTADNLENFKKAQKMLLTNLKRNGFDAIIFEFHQKKILESYLNSSKSWLHDCEHITPYETLTNVELPAFLSNTITTHVDSNKYASFIGLNDNNLPVTFSIFEKTQSRTNFSMFVGGMGGYGKSSLFKLMLKKNNSKGIKQLVLDVESEYSDLANTFDNTVIFSSQSMAINPLKPFVDNIDHHKVFLQDFFSLLLNLPRTSREIILLLRVWTQIVEKNLNEEININDIVEEIEVLLEDEQFSYSTKEHHLGTQDLNILMQLKDKLELDIKSELFKQLFNSNSELNIEKIKSASTVVFDLNVFKNISDHEYARAYSFLLVKTLDNVMYNNWINNPEQPILLYVDELHLYVKNNPYLLSWFNQCAGDLRKRNAGIITATQNIKDITSAMSSENNRKILDDVTYKVYFKSDDDSVEFLRRHFPMLNSNVDIQNKIKSLVKHNCIMFLGDKIIDLKVKITQQDFNDFGNIGK